MTIKMTKNTQRPRKRSLMRTAEQMLKLVTAQQMPIAGVEVDLNRNLIAIRIKSTPATTINETQESDEAFASWKAQHSPPRHP